MNDQPRSSYSSSIRLALAVIFVMATGSLFSIARDRMQSLESQVETMGLLAQNAGRVQSDSLEQMDAEFSALVDQLAELRTELAMRIAEAEGDDRLSSELLSLDERMTELNLALEDQAGSLRELKDDVVAVKTEELPALKSEREARLAEREARLAERYDALRNIMDSTRQVAEASMAQVDEVKRMATEERDLGQMWRELVGPVVQLAGDSSVGSGVLLESEPVEGGYRTLIMTAWHVVRDILEDAEDDDAPIPVAIYREDGSITNEFADVTCHNVNLDAAVLTLRSTKHFECGARLASRDRLDKVAIFKRIYAVGCPLGNDPIPTKGEVATCSHEIDGSTYWMINAPTYIGNSGGGIFDGETHELLGIFSKIYTHGSLRPTIVPHMGLVTPLDRVYDWLVSEGYASESSRTSTIRIASAKK